LESQINSLAFQGVEASAYPATLETYLAEGGSDSGAQSLASTVTDYVDFCPDSSVIISGWRSVSFYLVPSNLSLKSLFS
jgi:cutinase